MTDHYEDGPLTLRSFAGHARQPAPETVYHYTSQQGLLSIIEKAELWATKIQYMDDSAEFGLALDMARERVTARLAGASEHDAARLRQMSKLDGIAGVNIFVACFCEHSDLFGQWRAYSGASHGFAIEMKSARLAELGGKHHFRLRRCIYDPALQRKLSTKRSTPASGSAAMSCVAARPSSICLWRSARSSSIPRSARSVNGGSCRIRLIFRSRTSRSGRAARC